VFIKAHRKAFESVAMASRPFGNESNCPLIKGTKNKKKDNASGGGKVSAKATKEKEVVSNQKPLELKLLMLGDAGVGKTSLILRYCDDYFTDTFISSMGSDFKEKSVVIEGQPVSVELYDTAGQERFRKVTSSYFRGGQGVMIVFDVNNPASFENVRKWKTEVDRYAEDEVAIVLVGNKTDLERRVSEESARKLAAELGLPYTETSCKKPSGVEEAMLLLAKETKLNQEELDL